MKNMKEDNNDKKKKKKNPFDEILEQLEEYDEGVPKQDLKSSGE